MPESVAARCEDRPLDSAVAADEVEVRPAKTQTQASSEDLFLEPMAIVCNPLELGDCVSESFWKNPRAKCQQEDWVEVETGKCLPKATLMLQ